MSTPSSFSPCYNIRGGEHMLTIEQKRELYANGICSCMAAGRFKWKTIHDTRVYMCIKCDRPVYWPTPPYR